MTKKLVIALLLMLRGVLVLALALVDWLTAKVNVSERGYLLPGSVVKAFYLAIVAGWHGQRILPSRLACTNWKRNACGPSQR